MEDAGISAKGLSVLLIFSSLSICLRYFNASLPSFCCSRSATLFLTTPSDLGVEGGDDLLSGAACWELL